MWRPARILATALAIVVVTGAALAWFFREPTYAGRSASAWIADCSSQNPQTVESASNALARIGPAIVPVLRSMIRTRDTSLKSRLARLLQKQHVFPYHHTAALTRHTEAAMACWRLETQYRPLLVPDWLDLLANPALPGEHNNVVIAIEGAGPDALDALLRAARSPVSGQRVAVMVALRNFAAQKKSVVPVLLECLHDPSVDVRANAASSLGAMNAAPEKVLPPLVEAMSDPAPTVREMAAYALENFPTETNVIIPALIRSLSDADPGVRRWMTNVLRRVDARALEGR